MKRNIDLLLAVQGWRKGKFDDYNKLKKDISYLE